VAALAEPTKFAQLLHSLHRQDWVVYAKPAFGAPTQELHYLGRYTHRIAISNHRRLAFDGEHVTFRWKDYAHGGKHRIMILAATEFLRRFFLHVLPRGFVRIRHFGLLSNRFRSQRLPLCHRLMDGDTRTPLTSQAPDAPINHTAPWHCPKCGTAMIVLRRLTAAELSLCPLFDSS
jgi:Putative transposase